MIHTAQSLLAYALIPPINPYLAASWRNLSRHRASGAFDDTLALRLLRNNARDVARDYRAAYPEARFSDDTLDRVARSLLAHWRLTAR